MHYSRRDFIKMGVAGLPLTMALGSLAQTNRCHFHGVQLGVQTYGSTTFRWTAAITGLG